jgi:quercetin dioxygenase-like cupin family protein
MGARAGQRNAVVDLGVAKPESIPFEKVIRVTSGTLVTSITGTMDVLEAEVGDVVFVPANVEHSFMSVGPTGATAVFGMASVG